MRQNQRPYQEPDSDENVHGDELAAVNERLGNLTRQLEEMAQANAAAADPSTPDRVADALARLDRRLDQVIAESRAASSEARHQGRYAPPSSTPAHTPMYPATHTALSAPMTPPARPAPAHNPADWAAQISARQRALDDAATASESRAAEAPANWTQSSDFIGLEQQLRQIHTQISALHQPYEHALHALRSDLAEIGRALTEAMPRRAIESLEGEVRALAERFSQGKQAGGDGTALGALERELAEVRNALRSLTPAEGLAGFQDAVTALSRKIDQIATSTPVPHDPAAFQQFEQAVASLRGVVSNVASEGALAQLAAEVRGLGAQFERASGDSNTEALSRLESRIASLMESGRTAPPELEGSIRALSERLDRAHLSQGDQLALGTLEDRIAKLSEKLDASDSRLNNLDSIERGLADLLVHLEEMRNGGPRGLRASAPQESEPAYAPVSIEPPITPPAVLPEFVQPPLDLIPEMPAKAAPMQVSEPTPEPPLPPAPVVTFEPPAAPVAAFLPLPESRPQPARAMPRGPERQPINPNLPPDTPLEPGSGIPRVKPGSAAERIAASEAALGNSRPVAPETGGKFAAIAAARSAARAAALDTPVKTPKSFTPTLTGRFKWPFKKKAQPAPQLQTPVLDPVEPSTPTPTTMVGPVSESMSVSVSESIPTLDGAPDTPASRGKQALKILKTILIAASVAIIVAGTAQTAIELLFPAAPPTAPGTGATKGPNADAPKASAPPTEPSQPAPKPQGALTTPPGVDPEPTGTIDSTASFFDWGAMNPPAQPRADITGSIARKAAKPANPAPANLKSPMPAAPPAEQASLDGLPATISLSLRKAAAANDPAAEYELGLRYAEGRGVVESMPEAAQWFERAANAGFAPAQFRLGSLKEKGDGLKKDLQEARRLYLAAATKGHAKAMHNLAVLYAEGVDGKPDYNAAAEWFRKAAMHGVSDSQYNLAILYARGIGVPANLAESYRWFAIAAANGDRDSVRKRDEIASRLDKKVLADAKLAVQTFVPEREPEEATSPHAPPGGWDHAPAHLVKPQR